MAQNYQKFNLSYVTPDEKTSIQGVERYLHYLGQLGNNKPNGDLEIFQSIAKPWTDPTGNGVYWDRHTTTAWCEYKETPTGHHMVAMRHPEGRVTQFVIDRRIGLRHVLSEENYMNGLNQLKRAHGDKAAVQRYQAARMAQHLRAFDRMIEFIIKGIFSPEDTFLTSTKMNKALPNYEEFQLYIVDEKGKPIPFSEQMKTVEQICGCFDENGEYLGPCLGKDCKVVAGECKPFMAAQNTLMAMIKGMNKALRKNKITATKRKDSADFAAGSDDEKIYKNIGGFIDTLLQISSDLKSDDWRAWHYKGAMEYQADFPANGKLMDIDSGVGAHYYDVFGAGAADEDHIALGNFDASELVIIMNRRDIEVYNQIITRTSKPNLKQISPNDLASYFGVGKVILRDWFPRGQAHVLHRMAANFMDFRSNSFSVEYKEQSVTNHVSDVNFLFGPLACFPSCVVFVETENDVKNTAIGYPKKKT